MKMFLGAVLVLLNINSYAGTLMNRNTGEFIVFDYNETNQEVVITSHATDLASKTIALNSVRGPRLDNQDYLWLSRRLATFGDAGGDKIGLIMLMPPVTVIPVAIFVVDLIAIPFRGVIQAVRNIPIKRAHRKMLKAILTDETVNVSSRLFNRVTARLAADEQEG